MVGPLQRLHLLPVSIIILFLRGVPLPCLAEWTVQSLKARVPGLHLQGDIFYPRCKLPGTLVRILGTERHSPTLVALPQPVQVIIGFRLSGPIRKTVNSGRLPPTRVRLVARAPPLFPKVVVRSLVASAVRVMVGVPAVVSLVLLVGALSVMTVCNPALVVRRQGAMLPVAHAL